MGLLLGFFEIVTRIDGRPAATRFHQPGPGR